MAHVKKGRRKVHWIKRPEIQDYILDCYEGIDTIETPRGLKPYRAFMWAEGREVYIGNASAFAEHIAKRFRIKNMNENAYYYINQLLIEVGERIFELRHRHPTGKRPGTKHPKPRKERIK